MDTHIASHAIVDPDIATLSARLPGERAEELPEQNETPPFGPAASDDSAAGGAGKGSVGESRWKASGGTGPVAPEPGERLARSDASRPKRRQPLLLGVAVVALVAAGSGAFLISPYNNVYPVPRMASTVRHLAASAGINLPALVAPSASLASITLPPSAPVIHERYTPKPKDQEIQEVLGFDANAHPASSTGSDGSAPGARVPAGHPAAAAPSPTGAGSSAAMKGHPEGAAEARGTSLRADRHDDAGPPSGYVAHEPGSVAPPVRAAAAAPSARAPTHLAFGTSTVAQAPPAPAALVPPPQAIAARGQSQRLVAGAAGPPHDVTGAILSSLTPPRTAGAATSASASGQAPVTQVAAASAAAKPAAQRTADPITIAHDLRPAPMTPHDQIQVLNLVTEMATMLRDVRTQDAQLRADFSKSAADTADRLSDFERRLTLAEARNAIADARTAVAAAASGAAGDGANPSATPIPAASSSPAKTIPVRLTTAAALPGGGSVEVKRYRVQAASPGLALLAEIDRGGGEGAQLQVVVGDRIPGYGRVKSITQRGTSWVVSTEHGAIQ